MNGDGVIDFSVDDESADNLDLEVPSDEGDENAISTEVDPSDGSSEEDSTSSDEESTGQDEGEATGTGEGETETVDTETSSEEGEVTSDAGADSDDEVPPPEEGDDVESDADDVEASTEEPVDGEATDEGDTDTEGEATDGEEEEEEEEEEAGFLDSVAGQSSKKSKKVKTEESTMTKSLGELFKEKLLSEARAKKSDAVPAESKEDPAVVAAREKHDSALTDLLEAFPAKPLS